MKIIKWTLLSQEETLSRLKNTRLKGFSQPYVYEDSSLELLKYMSPRKLVPTQRYVLCENLKTIESLYREFLKFNINIFHLEGTLIFHMENDEGDIVGPIPLTPPIIEETHTTKRKFLISDGMHRIFAAKKLGSFINVIYVRDVPKEYPYYALPLKNGWHDVQELEFIPEGFVKKTYRDPKNYKDLFRNYNEIFPGIQESRPTVMSRVV